MTFDFQAMVESINANVVPQLPEEYHPKALHEKVTQDLSELIVIANETEKFDRMTAMLAFISELMHELLSFAVFLAKLEVEKLSEERKKEMCVLGASVAECITVAKVFFETLHKTTTAYRLQRG